MIRQLFLLAMGALALSACNADPPQQEGERASPILIELADNQGQPKGWLFGTIHSLPRDVQWRSETLDAAIADADLLMVEIAALDDQQALRDVFSRLASTPGQPDVGLKVPENYRPKLFDMIQQAGFSPGDLGATETWAVALLLAQLEDTGDAAHGADRALIRAFAGREIKEFEGAEKQLGIFDRLPESEQRDLLVGVIDDIDRLKLEPGKLRKAWLEGDETALIEATNSGILADRELRQALLVDRNNAWLDQLVPMLEQGKKPLVAVGAAHIVGPDGLAELLRQRGYTLTRIQ